MWKIIRILCIYQSRVQRRIFECILFTRFHNLFPFPLGYPKPVFSPGSPSCSKFPNLWIFQIIPKKSDCIKEFQFPIYNPPTLSHPWKNLPPPFSPLPFSFKIPCSSLRDVINLADSQQTGGTPGQQEARISGAILEMGFRPTKEQDRSVDDRSMWVVDRHVRVTNQKARIGHVIQILQ